MYCRRQLPVPRHGRLRGYYHLPKVNPQVSGGKEAPYVSISDQLQAQSDHCPYLTFTTWDQGIDHVGVLSWGLYIFCIYELAGFAGILDNQDAVFGR
jgi:hypothetical protein